MTPRTATAARRTAETDIRATLTLDGSGRVDVDTGLGFLDHMLTALGRHAGFDLELSCRGDLDVDDHHTVEDCALVLGGCLAEALGDGRGLVRFGSSRVPMDEALAEAAVDLCGRPWAEVDLGLRRERLGAVSCENLEHFFVSLATAGRFALHLDVPRGRNDHHRAEAAFKALAVALRAAVARTGSNAVPSTKEVLR